MRHVVERAEELNGGPLRRRRRLLLVVSRGRMSAPDARPRRLERFSVAQWFGLVVGGLVAVAAAGLVLGVVALGRLGDARALLVDQIDPALVASQRLATALSTRRRASAASR